MEGWQIMWHEHEWTSTPVAEAVWRALTDPARSPVDDGHRGLDRLAGGQPDHLAGGDGRQAYEDKGEVLAVDEPTRLSMTHYSPLMGQADEPENYHTVIYDLAGGDDRTTRGLSQDGNDSAEQAEQFSANWQGMLDALKTTVESG